MSTTIDERVVSMQFDNKQFENNVKTSISTLDKLKQSLNLSGASKGLENVGAAAKSCNLSPLGSAVETVKLKFSALEVMAVTALANITNSAVNAGKRLVSAFTIDPIKSGFQEYETQINAVQTILANTQSKGTTLDNVNAALDELNHYADKTIYNFTEMTRNIGTFTAAGVDLDTSVAAIKGIANLAAVSGSTSQQASTAMYQLSQALSSGTVKLMDWNSVVNAGMGGQVFQDALKETARVHGIAIDNMIKKEGSFRETLSNGWLSSEILTETLQKFTGDLTAEQLKSIGYTEEQANEILKLGQTANDAATKVKTFTQLMDTLKEAAQSGWTQTWELLIGDFDEAKSLWTGVSDYFSEAIGNSADARNKLLSGALTSGWDKMIDKLEEAGVSSDDLDKSLRETLQGHNMDPDKLIQQYGSLEKALQQGAFSAGTLKEALSGLTKTEKTFDLTKGVTKLQEKGEHVLEIERALKSLGYDLTGSDGKDYGEDSNYGTLTRDAVKEFQKANGLKVTGLVDDETLAALREATSSTKELNLAVDDLVDGVDKLGGRQLLIESFKNVWTGLVNIAKPVKDAFRDIFPPITSDQLYNAIAKVHELTNAFKTWTESAKGKEVIGNLTSTFKGFFAVIDIGINLIKSIGKGIVDLAGSILPGLGGGILKATGSFGEWLVSLRDSIKETDAFGKTIDKIVDFLSKGIDSLIPLLSSIGGSIWERLFGSKEDVSESTSFMEKAIIKLTELKEKLSNIDLGNIWTTLKNIGSKIGEVGSSLGEKLVNAFKNIDWERALDFTKGGLVAGILFGLSKIFNEFGDLLGSFKKDATKLTKGIKEVLESVAGCFKAIQNDINAKALLKIAAAIGILALSILLLSSIDDAGLLKAVGTITVLFAELLGAMKLFTKIGAIDKATTKAMITMVSMAAALSIMAGAIAKLSGLSIEQAIIGVGSISVLCIALATAMKIMQSTKGAATKGAMSLVAMAVAIRILAGVIDILGSMDTNKLIQGGSAVIILSLTLATAGAIMQASAKDVTKGAAQMLPMAVGLLILVKAIKILADMDTEKMIQGLIGVATMAMTLAVAATIMQENAKGITKGAAQMVPMAAALLLLTASVKILAAMDFWSMAQGLLGVTAMLGVLVGSMILLSKFGGGGSFAGAAASMILMGVAINILVPALLILGSVNPWVVVGGLLAIAGAFTVLGVAGLLLKPLAPIILTLTAALALIGVSIFAVGVGLAALATGIATLATIGAVGAGAAAAALETMITSIAGLIPLIAKEIGYAIVEICKVIVECSDQIGEAVKTLVLMLVDVFVECVPEIVDGLLVAVVAVLDSLAEHTPEIIDAIMQFLISALEGVAARTPELVSACMDVITSLFSAVTDALVGLDSSTLVKAAIGVALMSALMALFSAVAPLVPGALVGVLGMGVMIVELAAVLAAIGALAQIPGLKWLIGEGKGMLEDIGATIGGFIGGLVGGIAEGITSALPQIGNDLSSFMENITPFLDGAKGIDQSAVDGVGSIVDVITKITGASLLESITSWVTGSSSIDTFATQLPIFGAGLKAFSDSVAGINSENILAAASAGEALSTMADTIPNEGGLLALFTGDNKLDSFGTQLPIFGAGLKAFSDSVAGINSENITAAAAAGTALSAMADTIPNQGGLLSLFVGDNTLSGFGFNLKSFGLGLKSFSDSVSGIDADSVAAATSAGSALSAMADTIPNQGGLVTLFTGDNSLSGFGENVKSFGEGLKGFSDSVKGISVGDTLKAVITANHLVSIADSIKDGGFYQLSAFGGQIEEFVGSLARFCEAISGIDISKFSDVATGIAKLSAIKGDASGLQTFINSLGEIGTSGINAFVNAFSDASPKVMSAVSAMMSFAASAALVKGILLSTAFKTVISKAITSATSACAGFKLAGYQAAIGFANGLSSGTFRVQLKAAAMAKAALTATKKALGIKSPSREFYKAGAYSGQGYVNALSDYESKTYKAGAGIAYAAKSGLSNAISKMQKIIESDIDYQPTIRPVLDLSDIKSGVGAIDGMFGMTPSVEALSRVGTISSMMNNNQNGANNDDVITAIRDLGNKLGNVSGDTYTLEGITYDDGSNIANAVKTLVRAAKVERRI